MTIVIAALAGLFMGHALDIFFDRLYTDATLGGPARRAVLQTALQNLSRLKPELFR